VNEPRLFSPLQSGYCLPCLYRLYFADMTAFQATLEVFARQNILMIKGRR